MTTIIGNTTNYHNPLSQVNSASLIALNQVFGNLDAAIANLASIASMTVTVTAGEGLATNDAIYISRDDGKAYLLDNDAATAEVGLIRGFATETVSAEASVEIQIANLLDGFTGLTVLEPVYAGGVAGDITQARPEPVKGGNQVAIIQLGIAWSATQVLIRPMPVQYHLRDEMAEDDELSIVHHFDPVTAPMRKIWAYFSEFTAGAEVAGYASANRDDSAFLRYGGAGGTVTPASSGTVVTPVGNSPDWRMAQRFIPDTGELTQITFEMGATVGTQSGDLGWEIRESDGTTTPSTLITSGSHTPTASATNTITVSSGDVLDSAKTYWFILRALTLPGSGNYYVWYTDNTNPYADGTSLQSLDGGSTWTPQSSDLRCSITTSATLKDKAAQTFTLGSSTDVASVGLWLRKVGSPTGTATVRIETLTGSEPSGTLADPDATVTFSESSLGSSYAEKLVTFASEFTLASGTYALVLSTDRAASLSNYMVWGADASTPSYAGGEMFYEVSSSWVAESKDAVFSVYETGVVNVSRVSVDYWSSSHADLVNRYGDGAGSEGDIKTTFKCKRVAGFDDVTLVVEVA